MHVLKISVLYSLFLAVFDTFMWKNKIVFSMYQIHTLIFLKICDWLRYDIVGHLTWQVLKKFNNILGL